MSVIFLVTPMVTAAWPVFCGAAAAAAASLGFSVLEEVPECVESGMKSVELEVQNSEILTDQVRADEEMRFTRDDITVRVYKDPRGRCAIHVMGEQKTEEELREEGTRFMNRITQQYTYQKITREMKDRGFAITEEEVTEEGRIRICLRKYE